MVTKEKRRGLGLDIRTFLGNDGATYIAFKTTNGSYHVFKEVEAKDAARQCGATVKGNTRKMWRTLWTDKCT